MSEFIKAAVIGHPIKHSKSPLIHQTWIERYKRNGEYNALDIPPEELEARLPELVAEGYSGFNLTLPHKELALELCDQIDELARRVGAVNTISVRGGKLYGTNTDVYGFTENIKQAAPDFNFKSGPAVVLGAGGAARAVVHGLLQEGAPYVILTNRTRERALALAKNSADPARVEVENWYYRHEVLRKAALVVNTTSLGMAEQKPLELDLTHLRAGAHVCDIVYNPLMTELLMRAKQKGHPVITGIGMLLYQAQPAFHSWFGVLPAVDDNLKNQILRENGRTT